MREFQVKGLTEVKAKYVEQLEKIPEYQTLVAKFRGEALQTVRQALMDAGVKLADDPRFLEFELERKGCGFCCVCITSCTGCVAWAPAVPPAIEAEIPDIIPDIQEILEH